MWPFGSKNRSPLLRQVSSRLLGTLGVAVLIFVMLMGWIIHLSQERIARQQLQETMGYYSNGVMEMEQRWQEWAVLYTNRIELSRMLEDASSRWTKLNSYLVSQESNDNFPALLITDPRGRVIFQYGLDDASSPETFASPPDIGWHYSERDKTLYRYYVQHIWLGKEGMGHLILLQPMNNGLLHDFAAINTHLFLRWHGQVIASSLGEHGKDIHLAHFGDQMEHDGAKVGQGHLMWDKSSPDSPELVVHRTISSLFDAWEIMLGFLVGLVGLLVASWTSMGLWIYRLSDRISLVSQASRQLIHDSHHSGGMRQLLQKARCPKEDEINEVAQSLEFLTDTLAQRNAERDAHETALQESEARVLEITSVLAEGVYVLDQDGFVSFFNREAERLLGWEQAELLGKSGHDIFHYKKPDGTPICTEECLVHRTILSGQIYHNHNDWLVRKDGSIIPVSLASSPILRDGKVVGSVAAFHDITSRLNAEKTIRESEDRFRNILDNAPIGMAVAETGGRILQANQALCEILGFEKEELKQLTVADFTHPDDREITFAHIQKLLDKEADTYRIEKRYIRKDGRVVWVEAVASTLLDSHGKPLYFIIQVEDISAQHEAEKALHDSEERFRLISTSAKDGIIIVDPAEQISYWNPGAEKIFGYQFNEALGQNLHKLIAPSRYQEEAHQGFGRFLASGKGPIIGKTFEITALRKNGEEFPIELSISAFSIKDQWHTLGMVRDISERKKAEQEYRTIIQTTMDGFLVVGAHEGQFLDVNDAYCKMLGYSREEILSMRTSDVEAMESPDRIKQHKKEIRNSGHASFETRHRCKDGRIIDVEVTATYMDMRGGVLITFIRDIGDRKMAEEQIRQLAFYDTLTNLPNRRLLLDRLRQSLSQAKRHKRSTAVMFLDLDRFKQINDTLGHDAGDDLLKEVAARLLGTIRSGDTVCRQGGDEFVIILAEIAAPADAARVAEKIITSFEQPFLIKGHDLHITTSVGISVYPVDGTDDIDELLKQADLAMYQAKESGRNGYRFFQGS